MKGVKIFSTLLCLCLVFASKAQVSVVTQDFEAWNSIRLKKDFGKLDLALNMQTRLNNNAGSVYQYFGQAEATYKLFKPLSVGMGYRFGQENEKEGYINASRLQFDLLASKKLGDFKFNARLRYQMKNEEDELESVNKIRFKSGFRYNIPSWKLDPKFSVEYFRLLDGDNSSNDKMRYTLATDYKFNKHNSLGAFYRIEKEMKESYPATFYILGLSYTYKF